MPRRVNCPYCFWLCKIYCPIFTPLLSKRAPFFVSNFAPFFQKQFFTQFYTKILPFVATFNPWIFPWSYQWRIQQCYVGLNGWKNSIQALSITGNISDIVRWWPEVPWPNNFMVFPWNTPMPAKTDQNGRWHLERGQTVGIGPSFKLSLNNFFN